MQGINIYKCCVIWIYKEPLVLVFNISELENHQFQFFEKKLRINKNTGAGYFQKL
jgi:hypothetical protein